TAECPTVLGGVPPAEERPVGRPNGASSMRSQLVMRRAILVPLAVLLAVPVQALGNPRAVYALLSEAAGARAASQAARYGMAATTTRVSATSGFSGVESLSRFRLGAPTTAASLFSTHDPSLQRYLTGGGSAYRNADHEDAVHNTVLRILKDHPALLRDLPA